MTAPTEWLARELAAELGDAATVDIEAFADGISVTMKPVDPAARSIWWVDFAGNVVLQAGEQGGRWELDLPMDLEFMGDLARSVIAGRVVEVFARGRSRVTVTLADGSSETETGYDGCAGCLPLPFWRHWSRAVHYAAYRRA